MSRLAAYLLALLALAAAATPLRAGTDGNGGGGDDDAPGGLLVQFLEDTLSDDSRTVRVRGLEGALSSRATIRELTVSDDEGVWLVMRGAVLDWNRLRLLRGEFSVNTLSAEEIVIFRPPGTTTAAAGDGLPAPEATPFRVPELPVAVELGEIRVGRLELGAPVLGVPAELRIAGRLSLAAGALDTRLAVTRTDRPGDAIGLTARFDNATRRIALDLAVSEGPGGLISAALDLPGRPPLDLTAAGEGPVEDFTADIALKSAGRTRLSGQVRLRAADPAADPAAGQDAGATAGAESAAGAAGGIVFSADLAGDITPLLAPRYRAFFGTRTAFVLAGRRGGDGRLEIARLALTADALRLEGSFAMAADGSVERLAASGAIAPPDGGGEVILPVPGGETALARARFALSYEPAAGREWSLDLVATGLRGTGAAVREIRLSAAGPLPAGPGRRLEGRLNAALNGLAPADPALGAALGTELALSGDFAVNGDGSLRLDALRIAGEDYRASADGILRGLGTGFETEGALTLEAPDLGRFSGLAGRPLGGEASMTLRGRGAPLAGSFDMVLEARGRDLTAGIGRLDPLLAGETVLRLDAARDTQGVKIRAFSLRGTALTADLRGTLRSGAADLTFSARLADLAAVLPGAEGPLTLHGEIRGEGPRRRGRIRLAGPHESFAELTGRFADDGSAETTFRAELARLERFVPELAGRLTAHGTATRDRAGRWTLRAEAAGPAGIAADLSGTLDEAGGRADIAATGQGRLDLANLFIAPNALDGTARFELRLQGPPALDALSGRIAVNGATLAVPALLQTVQDIDATVTLGQGRVGVAATGTLGAGGGFRLSGPVDLRPPFDSRLTLTLSALGITDRLSLTTSASGEIVYAGPLTGNGRLSGQVIFGETDLNLNRVSGAVGAPPIPRLEHAAEPPAVRDTRRRAGLLAAEGGGQAPEIGLDLRLIARNRIFVHGFGLSAEMGGDITVRGTTRAVVPAGQIRLRRGSLDLVGRSVKLTRGVITLQGSLQPHVEFESTATTSEGQATFRISGPLNAPEIEVFAEPERPAEEALAMLLFGNRASELSPLVIAQMAASLARIGTGESLATKAGRAIGGGGDGGRDGKGGGEKKDGPLRRLLSGGYLNERIYTDFTVNTRGETELNLNLDVSDSVTLKGTVDNSGDTGVGVFFERDY